MNMFYSIQLNVLILLDTFQVFFRFTSKKRIFAHLFIKYDF